MINSFNGTPVTGYISLTNGAPGPVAFALFTVMGQAAYTLQANERVYITNITVSTNDTALQLFTLDSGGTTPTVFAKSYVSNTVPMQPINIPAGVLHGIFGVVPRAAAGAVTTAKTIEVVFLGYVSRT